MGVIVMAGQLILALAILVSLHEWGHYIAARSFGIRVEKFFIFFDAWGTKLFSKQVGETEWGIGWLPLGGYVKISGMIDESLDEEQLASEPKDYEFRSKPAWQRLIVMIGGVTVNFILGILIFALSLFYYGEKWLPVDAVNDYLGIEVSSYGERAGFEDGDRLLAVNGKSMDKFEDYASPIVVLKADSVTYTIERDGSKIVISLSEELGKELLESKTNTLFNYRIYSEVDSVFGEEALKSGMKKGDRIIDVSGKDVTYYNDLGVELKHFKGQQVAVQVLRGNDTVNLSTKLDTAGKLGIAINSRPDELFSKVQKTKYGFFEAFPAGTKKGLSALNDNIVAFGRMFKGKLNPVKSVSGPVGIAKIFGSTWNWQRFWQITGMLSFILAFMNLLPIPALDGGHVMFLLLEMLRGKPLPEKAMYYFQVVGMILLFALMGFIIFIDIFNAIIN